MNQKLLALKKNGTWVPNLPKGKKAIGSKWVYKVKVKPNEKVNRYKAHLVAKWYNQVEVVDFKERFSLIAKIVTIRIFISLATSKHWHIFQLNINNAFLHSFLKEEVYIQPSIEP